MSGVKSIAGEIAYAYCKENPAISSRGLAKKMLSENQMSFSGFGMAHHAIKRYRGQNGAHSRNSMKQSSECFVPMAEGVEYAIPRSYARKTEPYIIPVACEKIGVISDIHFPYHCEQALDTALKFLKKRDVDSILLNGDICDFYPLSSFNKKPDAPGLKLELEMVRAFLVELRKKFPKCKIIYKASNHENRLDTFLCQKAPELYGMEELRLTNLLNLFDNKIDFVEEYRIVKAGHLNILHGHELRRGISAPVNPARGAYLKTNDIVLVGHSHKSSSHTETDLNGKMISCWSTGAMCDLHPEYDPVANKWNHGFAIVERKGHDWFSLNNYKIIGEKEVVNA